MASAGYLEESRGSSTWEYDPKEDIKPFELAQMMPIFLEATRRDSFGWTEGKFVLHNFNGIEGLPEEVRRHFKKVN